jgi:hypothetical protein
LHGAGDAKTVQVGIGERDEDQVNAVLHALYQTV